VERINTKAELAERLKDVRIVEIVARKGYEEDLSTFKNFEILNTIQKIKNDEDKHIILLDEMIAMLSGGAK
jgi:rubrerythrin